MNDRRALAVAFFIFQLTVLSAGVVASCEPSKYGVQPVGDAIAFAYKWWWPILTRIPDVQSIHSLDLGLLCLLVSVITYQVVFHLILRLSGVSSKKRDSAATV